MAVPLISMFRSCAGPRLARYFAQVAALVAVCPAVRLIALEGDSVDRTREELGQALATCGVPGELIIREHGGPDHGSIVHPQRFAQLAYVVNGGLERVTEMDDPVVYVESDLMWRPEVFTRLAALLRPGIDIVAPAVYAGPAFYDVWGFRDLAGRMFGPFAPWAPDLNRDGLTEVASVGSCLVMRGEVARTVRVPPTEALVSFCAAARAAGFHVWADWRERIEHPC